MLTATSPTAIALPERLTLAEASATLDRLLAAVGNAGAVCRLDATPLAVLDTSAVAVLLECRRHAQALGKSLELHHAPAKLTALAGLYGVAGLLGLAAQPLPAG